jgi:formate dehydrogenase major subunit
MDLKHSDCVFIMGSNMAECHPVAFRWVVEAKTRPDNPAQVIHVDPRFTRTSALATTYAPLRAGADIAFLGALVKYACDRLEPIFEKSQLTPRERFHREYLVHYTNAPVLVTDDFRDTEEEGAAGLFSGFDPKANGYDPTKWRYDNGTPDGMVKPARITSDEKGGLPPSKPVPRGKPLTEVVKEDVPPPATPAYRRNHVRMGSHTPSRSPRRRPPGCSSAEAGKDAKAANFAVTPRPAGPG